MCNHSYNNTPTGTYFALFVTNTGGGQIRKEKMGEGKIRKEGEKNLMSFIELSVPRLLVPLPTFPKLILMGLFNNNGGPKIWERDAQIKMATTFKDKQEDSDFSFRLVLSESQIKSWFSSETGRRKKVESNRVIEEGFTELSQSKDIQDNEEGGHDQNKGVVEAGAPVPPTPPPSPPPL